VREHDFQQGAISDTVEIRSDEDAQSDGFESTDAEEKPARKSTAKEGASSVGIGR
jgi:hypothetical protein